MVLQFRFHRFVIGEENRLTCVSLTDTQRKVLIWLVFFLKYLMSMALFHRSKRIALISVVFLSGWGGSSLNLELLWGPVSSTKSEVTLAHILLQFQTLLRSFNVVVLFTGGQRRRRSCTRLEIALHHATLAQLHVMHMLVRDFGVRLQIVDL